MVPVKAGEFVFDPGSIRRFRGSLNWSQLQMAKRLEVPVNTVSRWETGAATPDAHSLAALYSIARSETTTIEFFRKATPMHPVPVRRTRLVVLWDFQNMAVQADQIVPTWTALLKFFRARYSDITPAHLIAFTDLLGSNVPENALGEIGFAVVIADGRDADSKLIETIHSLGGQKAQRTVLLLVTRDGDFASAIGQVKRKGTDVWIWGSGQESQQLVAAVGSKRIVPTAET